LLTATVTIVSFAKQPLLTATVSLEIAGWLATVVIATVSLEMANWLATIAIAAVSVEMADWLASVVRSNHLHGDEWLPLLDPFSKVTHI
jgi:hypothetical protein